jgi:hypothetical protein
LPVHDVTNFHDYTTMLSRDPATGDFVDLQFSGTSIQHTLPIQQVGSGYVAVPGTQSALQLFTNTGSRIGLD